MIAQRGAGAWLEFAGLVGFLLVNFAGVFVALFWGLRPEEAPKPQVHVDRGAVSDAGVPYVPGPPALVEDAGLPY